MLWDQPGQFLHFTDKVRSEPSDFFRPLANNNLLPHLTLAAVNLHFFIFVSKSRPPPLHQRFPAAFWLFVIFLSIVGVIRADSGQHHRHQCQRLPTQHCIAQRNNTTTTTNTCCSVFQMCAEFAVNVYCSSSSCWQLHAVVVVIVLVVIEAVGAYKVAAGNGIIAIIVNIQSTSQSPTYFIYDRMQCA